MSDGVSGLVQYHRLRRVAFLGCLAGIALWPSAASARGVRVRLRGGYIAGRGTHSGPVMSQSELERCVRLERDINAGADQIDVEERRINARSEEIERYGAEISLRKTLLNRYNQASVDSYNGMVNQHRAMVLDYNVSLPTFNARVEAHKTQVGEFNGYCAQKSYSDSDMQAVRSRLGIN